MLRRWSFMLLCLICLMGNGVVHAQHNRLLPPEDWTYDYIKRLQRRGHLLDLNPTLAPYRRGDVVDALDALDRQGLSTVEAHWVALLDRAFRPVATAEDEIAAGWSSLAGVRVINSDRLDPLRPLGDTLRVYWYGTAFDVYAEAGPVVAELGLWQDAYYDKDPDGLDTALRLFARSENTYAGVHTRYASAYLGRWSNHWGLPGEPAALISANPRSQDQVQIRLGGQRLAVTSLLAELDSITEDGEFTGRTGDSHLGQESRRRFLAAHRWDVRPSRNLVLAFMESAIYSGANAGPSLKYLNPLHPFLFVVDNIPKNDENNGFVAAMLWAHHRHLTLHAQFMIDDFDALGESGSETLTFALASSLVYALPSVDLGATMNVVTSRAYNSPQPEGDYVYLLRGLGTQFSDYVHASAFADVYLDALAPGLRLTPQIHMLAQGERDPRQPFPEKEEVLDNLLDGTVERTVRPALEMVYQPVPWWWIRLDGGVNFTTNKDHVEGREATRLVGLASFGVRLSIDRAFRLTF